MNHTEAIESLATERYLLGSMTDAERAAFEEHFFNCADCADDVRAATMMVDGAREGLLTTGGSTGRSNVLSWPRERRRTMTVLLPWAAAATLAVVAGYEALMVRQLTEQRAPVVALAPVTLRPASRGQEPVISPGPNGLVTVAVDLGGMSAEGDLLYELRRADGSVVAAGRIVPPMPGTPLLLMLRADELVPSEHNLLTIQNVGKPDLTRNDYRFTVGAR